MTSRRPSPTRSYKRRRGQAVSISAAPEPQQLLLLDNAVSLPLNGNMANTCLFLLVLAVVLQCSYGEERGIGRNCETTSDCDYPNAWCDKSAECKRGVCKCAPGYSSATIDGRQLCQKMKKLGERCDVITDKCYDGTCIGVCECERGEHATADRMQCVGNMYGEKCRDKEYNIYDWSSWKCETSKGLKCDKDTDKCVCIDGMKRVGDHCEFYKFGETCDHTASKLSDRKKCEAHLVCLSNECACSSTTQRHTFKMKTGGVDTTYERCVDKDATLEVKKSEKCIADYIHKYMDDKATICGDYLVCAACADNANEYLNNTRCISVGEYTPVKEDVTTATPPDSGKGGADSLRMSAVTSLILALVGFFVMRH